MSLERILFGFKSELSVRDSASKEVLPSVTVAVTVPSEVTVSVKISEMTFVKVSVTISV